MRDLEEMLRKIYEERKDKTMFIAGDGAALRRHRRGHRRRQGRRVSRRSASSPKACAAPRAPHRARGTRSSRRLSPKEATPGWPLFFAGTSRRTRALFVQATCFACKTRTIMCGGVAPASDDPLVVGLLARCPLLRTALRLVPHHARVHPHDARIGRVSASHLASADAAAPARAGGNGGARARHRPAVSGAGERRAVRRTG